MAELFARIKPRKSSTASEVPAPADLEVAELAINTADGYLFTKHTDGSIVQLGGTGGSTSIGALSDVDTSTAAPVSGQGLVWNGSTWVPGDVASDLSASSIDDLQDVDTTTTPPSDGQALVWDNASSEWKPGTPSGGSVDSVNGQVGVVSLDLEDIADVSVVSYPVARGTDFEAGQPIFRNKDVANATGGSLDTTLGTNAWKVVATDYYGTSERLKEAFAYFRRYDVVCMRIRSDQAFDTNNRISLGGNKVDITSGAGWTLYTRNTGFGFYCNGSYQEIGTRPTMAANTWHEVTYVLDWGSSQRGSLPAVSLWVDGAMAVNNITPSIGYSPSTSQDFYLAYSSSSQSNSGTKFIDFVRVATSDTLPWGMSDPTLTDTGRNLTDGITATLGLGDFLIYNGSQWVPSGHALSDGTLLAQSINDLSDVTYDEATGHLQIEGLDRLYFTSNDVPNNGANDRWGMYANPNYGVTVGEYNVSNDQNATRTFYSPSHGIIHNSGRNQLHWLMGRFSSTTNTPELRWTSGNPNGNSGNYVGIKLPAGISGNTTYILPLTDGSAGQVLSTDGSGALSWASSSSASLGDLSDVSYSSGSLEPTGLDQIVFSSADVPAGSTWKIFAATGGVGLGSQGTGVGSYIDVHESDGITLKANLGNIHFAQNGGGAPTLKLWDGSGATGNFVGFTIPTLSASTTYTLPAIDGSSGQVLSTDGAGAMSWIDTTGGTNRIQDQVDVDTEFTYQTWNIYSNVAWSNPAGRGGFWVNNEVRVNRNDGDGNYDDTDYSFLIGETVTIAETDLSTSWDVVITGYESGTEYGGWYKLLFDPIYGNPPTGNYIFTASASGSVLAEGDVLQWDDVDQKFKPAQLPADADTKRIQDQTDFEALTGPGTASFTARASTPVVEGDWAAFDSGSGAVLQWASTGDEHDKMVLLQVGDSITVNWGAGDETHTIQTAPSVNNQDSYFLRVTATAWTHTNGLPAVGAAALAVTSTRFGTVDLPLVDGDILQWNNTDQKFKPLSITGVFGGEYSGGIPTVDTIESAKGWIFSGQAHTTSQADPSWDPTNTSNANWDANFGGLDSYKSSGWESSHHLYVEGVGVAGYINQNGGNPTVFPYFSLDWTMEMYASNGCWTSDNSDFDLEFLDANSAVVCAIRVRANGNYKNSLRYGADLNNLVYAPQCGSYPRVQGELTFGPGRITYTDTRLCAGNGNIQDWFFDCDMASVTQVRLPYMHMQANWTGGSCSALMRVALI